MQKLYVIIPLIILFLGCFTYINAQSCADGTEFSLNENDFPQTCVTTDGTGGTAPSATFNHDFVTNTAGVYTGGTDGTDDVMVSMNATCSFPNGTNGTTQVGACLGPDGLDVSQSGFSNVGTGGFDFGGYSVNDAPCAGCWVEICYDFINGFSSTADGFDVDWSSLNGSTEGLEVAFGYVEGVDNTGTPFSPGVSAAGLSGYCPTQVQTLTASEFLTGSPAGGPLPPGVFGADAITGDGTATLCPTEEPGSSSGPNSTVTTGQSSGAIPANWGLNPNDVITKFCIVYLLSNSNADDCDGDNATNVNTSPKGNLSDVDFCVPAPVCMISNAMATAACDPDSPADAIVTVTFDESLGSGTYDIVDATSGAVVGTATGAMTGVGTGTGTFTITGPTTATPGVMYTIVDQSDAACTVDFTVDIPECVILCPDYTATISGGGQVCNNAPVDLFVTMDGGTGPYEVTLSDGTVITGYMSGDAIPVAPAMNTTYGVAMVTDADGCPAMVAGMAEVMVIISCANAGSLNGSGN